MIIWWFQALSAVTIGRIKLIEKTDITRDAFYFSEKIFEEIKKWGTIDFEEYFNRKVVNLSPGENVSSGHYIKNTWYGNFWNGWSVGNPSYGNGFYFCRSTTSSMWTWGCYNNTMYNDLWISGWPQRYGQYAFQFIDYNANENNDLWDEDNDGKMRGDDDDENLWEGPVVFTGWVDVREIYLISWDKKKRTLLRWNWIQDNDAPGVTCDPNESTIWGWCRGTIELLRLEWYDWWMNHAKSGTGYLDGVIDTWLVDKEFTGGAEVIAGSEAMDKYRIPLFPNSVTITDFQVFMYPNINRKFAWKTSSDTEVNPYVKIMISISPSWKKRAAMKWQVPSIKIATTINLSDYFSK